MFKYELMFIVRPNLEEAEIKKVAEEMKKTVESFNAKVVDFKDMGQRELAYEIKTFKNGYYFLLTIETEDDKAINEFSRLASINENIIRSLVVKVDE